MNVRFVWVCVCIIFCLGAQPQLHIISIDTDNSVSTQVVMDHYFRLPETLKSSVKFYQVAFGKIYWFSATLKVISSTDSYTQVVNTGVSE